MENETHTIIFLPDNGRSTQNAMEEKMSRDEKIKFLHDMEAGKASITHLAMPEHKSFYETKDRTFQVGRSNLTREELNKYIQARPAKRVWIYTRQEGNEPLDGEEDRVLCSASNSNETVMQYPDIQTKYNGKK